MKGFSPPENEKVFFGCEFNSPENDEKTFNFSEPIEFNAMILL